MRTNYPRHLTAFRYVGVQRYFLTFCCVDRQQLFTADRVVTLVIEQFLRAAEDFAFTIIAYCFMPDHVHLVVEGTREDSDLKQFVSRAKQFSGYYFSRNYGARLWQRYGYERVLRDDESTRGIVRYALENPVRARMTADVRGYPHVGSSLYSREELIEFAYGSG
jgi:putative transposase